MTYQTVEQKQLQLVLRSQDISSILKHFSLTIQQRFQEIDRTHNFFTCLNSNNYQKSQLQRQILNRYYDYKTSNHSQIRLVERFIERIIQIFEFFKQKSSYVHQMNQIQLKLYHKLKSLINNNSNHLNKYFLNNKPKTQKTYIRAIQSRALINNININTNNISCNNHINDDNNDSQSFQLYAKQTQKKLLKYQQNSQNKFKKSQNKQKQSQRKQKQSQNKQKQWQKKQIKGQKLSQSYNKKKNMLDLNNNNYAHNNFIVAVNKKTKTEHNSLQKQVDIGQIFKYIFSILKKGYLMKMKMEQKKYHKNINVMNSTNNNITSLNNITNNNIQNYNKKNNENFIIIQGTGAILRSYSQKCKDNHNNIITTSSDILLQSQIKHKLMSILNTNANNITSVNFNNNSHVNGNQQRQSMKRPLNQQQMILKKVKARSIIHKYQNSTLFSSLSNKKGPEKIKIRQIDRKLNILASVIDIDKYYILRTIKQQQNCIRDMLKRNAQIDNQKNHFSQMYNKWKFNNNNKNNDDIYQHNKDYINNENANKQQDKENQLMSFTFNNINFDNISNVNNLNNPNYLNSQQNVSQCDKCKQNYNNIQINQIQIQNFQSFKQTNQLQQQFKGKSNNQNDSIIYNNKNQIDCNDNDQINSKKKCQNKWQINEINQDELTNLASGDKFSCSSGKQNILKDKAQNQIMQCSSQKQILNINKSLYYNNINNMNRNTQNIINYNSNQSNLIKVNKKKYIDSTAINHYNIQGKHIKDNGMNNLNKSNKKNHIIDKDNKSNITRNNSRKTVKYNSYNNEDDIFISLLPHRNKQTLLKNQQIQITNEFNQQQNEQNKLNGLNIRRKNIHSNIHASNRGRIYRQKKIVQKNIMILNPINFSKQSNLNQSNQPFQNYYKDNQKCTKNNSFITTTYNNRLKNCII